MINFPTMNLSNSTSPQIPNLFSRISSPRPYFASSIHTKTNHFRIPSNHPLFFINIPSQHPFTPRCSRPLSISAHLRRPPRRRNKLREKLVIPFEADQVRKTPESPLPDPNFNILSHTHDETINIELDKREVVQSFSSDKVKSDLWGKLEGWVDKYKEDSEFWGIGTGPIFTIHQDANGDILRVSVNAAEISKRSQIRAWSLEKKADMDLNFKISRAKMIAKEIETGEHMLPRNSSIVKFVVEGKKTMKSLVLDGLHSVSRQGENFVKVTPRIGFVVLCGWCALYVVTKLFVGRGGAELTREEVEMLERKKKSRMEREELEKGSIMVIQKPLEPPMKSTSRPQLDKDELMKNIIQTKASRETLTVSDPSSCFNANGGDFADKVREIRQMARRARELEQQAHSENGKEEGDDVASKLPATKTKDVTTNSIPHFKVESLKGGQCHDGLSESRTTVVPAADLENKRKIIEDSVDNTRNTLDRKIPMEIDAENAACSSSPSSLSLEIFRKEESFGQNVMESNFSGEKEPINSVRRRPKIIRSPKDARDYLARKRIIGESIKVDGPSKANELWEEGAKSKKPFVDTKVQGEEHVSQYKVPNEKPEESLTDKRETHSSFLDDSKTSMMTYSSNILRRGRTESVDSVEESRILSTANLLEDSKSAAVESSKLDTIPDLTLLAVNSSEVGSSPVESAIDGFQNEHDLKDFSKSETSFLLDSDQAGICAETSSSNTEEMWVEKNFDKFNPILEKIGVGFKENYMVAKEKMQEQPNLRPEISELGLMEEDGEHEWMNDDRLREIVFQVRENELAGRDPFHLMNAKDQHAFFEGLERKTEKVSEKLLGLHEWVHSRIENLDYGADGISLDDPLEKIIPRWKGPTVDRDPDFLHKFTELQSGNGGNSNPVKGDTQRTFDKSEDSLNSNAVSPYSPNNGTREISPSGASTSPKTLVECSDGSSRPGKKTGKEHWQHTKRWSQGFLDVYNAETDPEIKSIMKDMGKDLDRWITEKETKDAADLMARIPKKKRKYIEKKMEKLKREMETFGAQAVVSKYKEYSDDKEEDYLWWLDLDFVLCIELYSIEDDIPKVGFYSLEMAADLELDPKQYHVIAFEDAGDSKNFCYIVQAHMDMLGGGKAFVVAQPPKDAFREAKSNGFNVTVIRTGELKLNVDQTLEEVEEQVAEIGSKIYHDKIMRERSVDIYSLLKGSMTADKSNRRRSKRILKKPTKS